MLLKNGHVVDPLNGINRVVDVLIKDGVIDQVGVVKEQADNTIDATCLLYTSPSPRDRTRYRIPSSA